MAAPAYLAMIAFRSGSPSLPANPRRRLKSALLGTNTHSARFLRIRVFRDGRGPGSHPSRSYASRIRRFSESPDRLSPPLTSGERIIFYTIHGGGSHRRCFHPRAVIRPDTPSWGSRPLNDDRREQTISSPGRPLFLQGRPCRTRLDASLGAWDSLRQFEATHLISR